MAATPVRLPAKPWEMSSILGPPREVSARSSLGGAGTEGSPSRPGFDYDGDAMINERAPVPGGEPAPLVWLDMEMTGLHPETATILEVAAVITDASLNVVAEGPDLVVHQPDAIL